MKELIHQENDFSLEKYGDLVGTKNVGRMARIVFQICHTRLIECSIFQKIRHSD
jgi:hypothetical protein